VTDVLEEATAAKKAGLDCVIAVRPGNKDITETHSFSTISSLKDIEVDLQNDN